MSAGAEWAIVVIVFVNSLFVAGIALALWLLQAKLGQVIQQVQPLVVRSDEALGKVEALAEQVNQRLAGILDATDHVVRNVSQRVETTTSIAEETISQPLIGAASLMAGISRGLSTYRELTEKGDGQKDD